MVETVKAKVTFEEMWDAISAEASRSRVWAMPRENGLSAEIQDEHARRAEVLEAACVVLEAIMIEPDKFRSMARENLRNRDVKR